ncbi:MAG: hypothetical protein IJS97_08535 [Prevotella sp.]|nr:hypothetical protein [Prevotella sp.]
MATKYALASNRNAWNAARTAAQTAIDNATYSNVTGDERTDLQAEIDKSEPSTADGYNDAKDALEAATSTFTGAKENYDFYVGIKAENEAMGAATLGSEPSTASAAVDAANALKVNQYTYATSNYTSDVSDLYVGSWTIKTNFDEVTNTEHWSGNSTKYFNKWAANGTTSTLSQTMALPAGSYMLKVAGRGDTDMSFSDGTVTKYFQKAGGVGLGINLEGEASYDSEDTDGFANTTGRGWEWRFIKLTLEETTNVTVTLQMTRSTAAGWGSISDFIVLATPLTESLNRYNLALNAAQTALGADEYANVLVSSEAEALTSTVAEDESLDKTSTSALDAQKEALETATATFTNATTVANYNRLAAAIAKAEDLSVDHDDYDATTSTTAADALTNANALYTSMLSAQKAAKAQGEKVLGFESGEYAPYNNVDMIAAWAKADAITSVAEATTDDLDEAIDALNDASWSSANASEVNAIYDGTLKDAPIQATSSNVVLPGWVTKSGNTRQTFKGTGGDGKACLEDADDGVGVFVHPGTYNYGETTGYTMPLKANVLYTVKAKYCSWEDNSNNNFTLTIKRGNTTIASKSFGANKTASTVEGALKEVQLPFMADESADYVLSVVTDGNTFMTDFYILKATALTIADTDASVLKGFTNNVDVTVNRTLVADKWQGFSLPFDLSAEEIAASELNGATIAQFKSSSDNVITFEAATAIEAGVPYLIKPAEGDNITSMTFTGKTIAADVENQIEGEGDYQFKAQLFNESLPTDGTIAYMSTGTQKLKKLTSGGIKGTRAYFIIPEEATEARIVIEGEEVTSIQGAEFIVTPKDGVYYDLQGRKLTGKPTQRGIYIVNGKKVFVK